MLLARCTRGSGTDLDELAPLDRIPLGQGALLQHPQRAPVAADLGLAALLLGELGDRGRGSLQLLRTLLALLLAFATSERYQTRGKAYLSAAPRPTSPALGCTAWPARSPTPSSPARSRSGTTPGRPGSSPAARRSRCSWVARWWPRSTTSLPGAGDEPPADVLPATRSLRRRRAPARRGDDVLRVEGPRLLLRPGRRRQHRSSRRLDLPDAHPGVRGAGRSRRRDARRGRRVLGRRRARGRPARRLLRRLDHLARRGPFKGGPGSWGW